MNNNHIITFALDDTAQYLWTEAVPLHEFGRLNIQRDSTIEFQPSTQHWEVEDANGKVRFFAKSRSAFLEWEQQNLQPE